MSSPIQTPAQPSSAPDTIILVPAYREALAIGSVVQEIRNSTNAGVLVVNRSSGDGTEGILRESQTPMLVQDGWGKGHAIRQGIRYILRTQPHLEFIGLVDADGTYSVAEIESMQGVLRARPEVGMVVGRRVEPVNYGQQSLSFAVGNRMLARAHAMINSVRLWDPLSGLRLLRAELVKEWNPESRSFDIECEMNNYILNVCGYEIVEVPVTYRPRVGEKKLGLRHGILILFRMVVNRLRARSNAGHRTPATDKPFSPVRE